jgi:hypothetical protein
MFNAVFLSRSVRLACTLSNLSTFRVGVETNLTSHALLHFMVHVSYDWQNNFLKILNEIITIDSYVTVVSLIHNASLVILVRICQ